jgi:hypothetical protein
MKLALAAGASAAVVLAAPFMGQLNAWLRRAFPEQFLPIVMAAVIVLVAAGVLIAARHIRDRRGLRYGALAAALAFGVAYSLLTATGSPEVDWAERVHFVEYGLIAFLFYRAWRAAGDPACLLLPVLAGLFVGLAEEWLQWFIPVRVGELHDVLLNLVAVSCGLVFSVAADPPATFAWRLSAGSRRRLAIAGGAVVLALAFFIDQVHLGHVLALNGAGEFRSHYTAARLIELSRDRAVAWQSHPPLTLRRLSREDQYMDEGLWHVRRRNLVEPHEAWAENQILETFYAPVLDTPSFQSATGHRWSPEQRAEAEAHKAGDQWRFVSQAQPYPIYTFPRWWLWSAAMTLVAALAGYGYWPQRTQR